MRLTPRGKWQGSVLSTLIVTCRSVARGILKDERDVEECVNDTCMRAWNAIPPEKPRSLEAYLVRITRNLALDRYAYTRRNVRPH